MKLIRAGAPVYLTTKDNNTMIIPPHQLLAIYNDKELIKLLSTVTITKSGVVTNILAIHLANKIQKPK